MIRFARKKDVDRMQDLLEGQLGHWRALHVRQGDGVQRDVDAACVRRHSVGVLGNGAPAAPPMSFATFLNRAPVLPAR